MKKRKLNIIDVLIILTVLACAAGIIVRAVTLSSVSADKSSEYRVAFTAQITEEQKEKIDAGIDFTDKNGVRFTLLEGYWIKTEDEKITLNGELLVTGRLTEAGLKCGENVYFKKDALALSSKQTELDITVVDFLQNT